MNTRTRRPIQTLRFWHYDPKSGSHIKISLRKNGDAVVFYEWSRTDEGWSSTLDRYTRNGDTVTGETIHDGKDCDGRLTQIYEGVSHYWQLKSYVYDGIPADVRLPVWDKTEASQRDYSAEAMGY